MASESVTLPFEFDTTGVVKQILSGVAAMLGLIVLPGIVYCLAISHQPGTALGLLASGAIAAWFGRAVWQHLVGSTGTITADGVLVHPGRLFGLRMPGPAGRFSPASFSGVRVERVFGPIDTSQPPNWHERVWLVGSALAPDVLVGRTQRNAGIALGNELASLLGLPYRETVVPY
jgi:hypothetical protein